MQTLYLQFCEYGYCLIADKDVSLLENSSTGLGWVYFFVPFVLGIIIAYTPILIKLIRKGHKQHSTEEGLINIKRESIDIPNPPQIGNTKKEGDKFS